MVRVTSVEVSKGFELLLGFTNGERKSNQEQETCPKQRY